VIQAPEWLPYRWRERWDQSRVLRALKGLDKTAPMPAAKPHEAPAEAHILFGRRDLELGLLAIKSLLHFTRVPLAVTCTDDSSLDARDRDWISKHIPGVRWLPRIVPEVRDSPVLKSFPRLSALYNGDFHMISKLLHPVMHARCERIIQIDADTAFFSPSPFLEDWARRGTGAWFMADIVEKEPGVPAEVRSAFDDLSRHLTAANGRTWTLERFYFNAGFLLYRPIDLDLTHAEGFLEWRTTAPASLQSGPAGIWFGDWTREQTAYLAMFALAQPAGKALGHDFSLGFAPDCAFNHFMRHFVVQPNTLTRLRALVGSLPRRAGG
jgi:hypothetical protein